MAETIADLLVSALVERGVERVFAIPGVHNTELFRNLEARGLDVVLPRHEQGAGFMADGHARASGRPGVCLVITGPGLTNLMTPFGQAYSDSIPMLAISTVLATRDVAKGRGLSHDMKSQAGAIESFGAMSLTVDSGEEIGEALSQAWAVFESQRPRPVHLQVPIDRLAVRSGEGRSGAPLAVRPVPPAAALDAARQAIRAARRPLIVAGGGALDCGPTLEGLAETIGAAVVTTIAGKGVVPESRPRSLGCTLFRRPTQQFIESCDLALVVGSELAQTDFGAAGAPFRGRLVRIDIDPQALATNAVSDVPLLGDAAATLELLADGLAGQDSTIDQGEIATLREAAQRDAHAERPGLRGILQTIRAGLPEQTLFALDMTEIAYLANEVFEMPVPRAWFHPVGFGTLGYALPAAIGAKLARPETPVAAMIGDFGLQYTLSDLAVACERGLSLPIFVWNNEKLHAIEKDMLRKQMKPVAVAGLNPDFQALATAYGAAAEMPETLEALGKATAAALERPAPTLIELRPRPAFGSD